ncbi:MAG: exonuclease domain-containing protein [Acidimicrobiia bacterium]|nr:exonuclease domain-containing protein [Acidimicrobiia bacterium]
MPEAATTGGPDLERLAGGADRVAVVDCETTGVYNTDRIVELAIVTVGLDGTITEVWETLVQPRRDVGPTHIHGLTAEALRDAPLFADVAGDVAIRLHGACVAAHNLPFDLRMIGGEFGRLDAELTILGGIDTLQATGCRLGVACQTYGVGLANAHSAAADATATAQLLLCVAATCEPGAPAAAPTGLLRSGRVLRRADAVWATIPDPPYLAVLAARLDHAGLEAGIVAYLELVERAVADLHLDADERTQLTALADDLGLTAAQRAQAHRRFVNDLVDVALDDGVVTDDELDALLRVASALDVDAANVRDRVRGAIARPATVTISPGMTAVFTGDDPDRSRAELTAHAEDLGLAVGHGVTKATDLLVAYDTASNSGKATKARSYGVPVVSTAVFATATAGAAVEAEGRSVEARKVVTCPDCHATWTVSARSGERTTKRCTDCSTSPPVTQRTAPATAAPARPTLEELTCARCAQTWTRERVRGRKPRLCPTCANVAP